MALPLLRKTTSCPRSATTQNRWRGLDFGGIKIYLQASVPRTRCPKHGVRTASVPWAFPGARFTKDFDYTATWMGKYLSRSALSRYMRIDWETVGRCITRAHNDIEPDVHVRFDGPVNIGIDETSYQKGHKYITVVVNHDTNTVVWAGKDHGKSVLEKFLKLLTEEQRAPVQVVTGDGQGGSPTASMSTCQCRTMRRSIPRR